MEGCVAFQLKRKLVTEVAKRKAFLSDGGESAFATLDSLEIQKAPGPERKDIEEEMKPEELKYS